MASNLRGMTRRQTAALVLAHRQHAVWLLAQALLVGALVFAAGRALAGGAEPPASSVIRSAQSWAYAGCGPDKSPALRIDVHWPLHAVSALVSGALLKAALQGQQSLDLPEGTVFACEDGTCRFPNAKLTFSKTPTAVPGSQVEGELNGEFDSGRAADESAPPLKNPFQTVFFSASVVGSNESCGETAGQPKRPARGHMNAAPPVADLLDGESPKVGP